jgi:hypothetical protein
MVVLSAWVPGALAATRASVTGVTPATGGPCGGESVTITGSGFTGAADVEFGSVSASSFKVLSDTKIVAIVPYNSASGGSSFDTPVDVRVYITGVGLSAINGADVYTYSVHYISVAAATPTVGYEGSTITVVGTGFCQAGLAVTFGGHYGAIVATLDDSHIEVQTAYGADSPVTRNGGTVEMDVFYPNDPLPGSSGSTSFTYLPQPDVTGLSPSTGPEVGGGTVDITGSHFTGATDVSFGNIRAASFTVKSDTEITAAIPGGLTEGLLSAGTESVNVYVTGPGPRSANDRSPVEAAATFTYIPAPPRVDIIDPPTGPTGGGNTVQITGAGFQGNGDLPHPVNAVSFGGVPATSFNVIDDSHISAVVPPHAHGSVDVTLTSPIGTSATTVWDLYDYGPAPTVTHLSPATGAPGGGNTVVITGTGFLPGTSVTFGSTRARSVTYLTIKNQRTYDEQHLQVVVPPGGQGQVDVHVTNGNGSSPLSSLDTYWYAPTLATHDVPTWLAAAPGRSGAAATATSLLHNGGLTLGVHPAGPGTAAVNWYAHPGHGRAASEAAVSKGILVASGRQRFAGRAAGLIKIRLTAGGKRLLSAGKALPITSTATFTPRNGTAISATKHVVLKP